MSEEAGAPAPEEHEIDHDGRVVVQLLYPVTVAGREITAIRLRRIRVKDLEAAAAAPEAKQSAKLISIISGEPPVVIGELDAADATRIGEVVEGFQMAGRQTGASGSS